MSVLPESMASLPREDVGKSLKMLEDYVRYMGERMEFSVSGLNKSSAGELTALRERLAGLEAQTRTLEAQAQALEARIQALEASLRET